jgi:hypothetical protein
MRLIVPEWSLPIDTVSMISSSISWTRRSSRRMDELGDPVESLHGGLVPVELYRLALVQGVGHAVRPCTRRR